MTIHSEAEGLASLYRRFWKYTRKGEGCWEWTGHKSNNRYGSIAITFDGRRQRHYSAHRISYEIHFGKIPDGLVICHRCDNPGCVNPAHLFAATQADNMRDKEAKKRANHPTSAVHWKAREYATTPERVMVIRRLAAAGVKQDDLAILCGMTRANISNIVTRKTWQNVA